MREKEGCRANDTLFYFLDVFGCKTVSDSIELII